VPDLIISSTEPPSLRALGTSSTLPERYGADIIARWGTVLIGVQRKTWPDFVASCMDGRIGRQGQLMAQLPVRVLVLEGRPTWVHGTDVETGMPQARFVAQMWSLQAVWGWSVLPSGGLAETVEWVRGLGEWCKKAEHGRVARGKAKGKYGTATTRDRERWLLEGIDGIGPELAERIIERFEGVPLTWTCAKEEMLEVEGVGKAKVEAMWRVVQ
jgi:ERCC4-type nuclease